MIPEETVARIRDATDIVEFIGRFVALKRDGAGYKGRCPFHNEKSGSFNVNPAKQFYLCFGCRASGDVIRFVQDFKQIPFAEAVKELAGNLNIHVEENARPRKLDRDDFHYADPEPAPRPAPRPEPTDGFRPKKRQRQDDEPSPDFDWDACVAAFTPEDARKLAEWRGFSIGFVEWLHGEKLIGIHKGKFAIPVHDPAGNVVRCHYRLDDGRWMYEPKGGETAPLVIGDLADAGHVLAFESQWDALAVLDQLGYHEDPRGYAAIITRGATSNTDFSGYKVPQITAVPQNDPHEKRNKKTGRTPAEDWLEKIRETKSKDTRLLIGNVPPPWKDANDWIRDGKADPATVRRLLTETAKSPVLANALSVSDLLRFDVKDDPDALIGYEHRFLCKGGSMIISGPSGIGKSTLTMSMATHWSAGAAWHGIKVRRPLKTWIIQAENDKGDLTEMLEGAAKLAARAFEVNGREAMARNLNFLPETERTAETFCKWLEEVIQETGAELLFIDPLLSYVGGDLSKQEVASQFFRTWLQPVLKRTGAIVIFVHHTGKTSSNAQDRKHWNESDYAYIGMGSSEVTNWPRATAAILPIPGHEGKFKLTLTKRGKRAGMIGMDGQVTTSIYLEHGKICDGLAWDQIHDPEKEEKAEKAKAKGRKINTPILDVAGYLKFLPDEGCKYQQAVEALRVADAMTHQQAKVTISMLLKNGHLVREHKDGDLFKAGKEGTPTFLG